MTETHQIRFGILGCAGIARKVSRAITLAPNALIHSIASRSLEKATNYAAANKFPPTTKIYGSYEALLDDSEIDAVYIPLPTRLHLKWVTLAASKKKHVLLEKPVALDLKEFDEILKVCEENGVQLMDGTMWMHHPRTAKMEEFLTDADRFGQLRTVHSCFTYCAADPNFLKNDIRVKPDLDALGALGDIGWYCVRSILFVFGYELPKSVQALPGAVLNEAGVVLSCSAFLHWADGRTATFHCSFLSNLTMNLNAIGTNGTLTVSDFVIPYEEHEASFSTGTNSWFNDLGTAWGPAPSEHIISTDLPQEALMVREFANLVTDIKTKGATPNKHWPTLSRKTQLILDAVKESIDGGFVLVEIVG